jgi:hypothetical protein
MPDRTKPKQHTAVDEFRTPEFARELGLITPTLEHEVGITRDDLASLLLLDSMRGFGPLKFKELHEAGLRPIDVLLEPVKLPIPGKRGDAFREAISGLHGDARDLAQARARTPAPGSHRHLRRPSLPGQRL